VPLVRRSCPSTTSSIKSLLAQDHLYSDNVHIFWFKAPKNVRSVPLFDTTFDLFVIYRENDNPVGYFYEVHAAEPGLIHCLAKPLFYASIEYAEPACRLGRRAR
jgi:hypothetical protein